MLKLEFNDFMGYVLTQQLNRGETHKKLHYLENDTEFVLYIKSPDFWEYYTKIDKTDISDFGKTYSATPEQAITDFKLFYLFGAREILKEESGEINKEITKGRVIAIGPKGGRIVGYGPKGEPIYEGSPEDKKRQEAKRGEEDKKLTSDEQDAIEEYTSGAFNSKIGGYGNINSFLREGKFQHGKPDEKDIEIAKKVTKDLTSAIDKSPLSEDITLYRGVRSGFEHLQKGSVVTDSAFLSTSSSKKIANKFTEKLNKSDDPVLFVIQMKKGDPAVLPKDRFEKEFILHKESKLNVTNIKKVKGVRNVFVEYSGPRNKMLNIFFITDDDFVDFMKNRENYKSFNKELNPGEDIIEESKDYEDFLKKKFHNWEVEIFKFLDRTIEEELLKDVDYMEKSFGEFIRELFNRVNTLGFRKGLIATIKATMKDGVIEAEKELNIDVGFSPEMMKETKVLADRQLEGFYIEGKRWKGLKGVSEDVQLEVSQVVRDGIVNKEGLGEIKKQIKERLDVTSSRAEAIARTETTRFSNHAKLQSYIDSGLVESIIWDAHLDNRTSPICEKLNNQEVPLGKYFQVETNKGLAEFTQPPAHVNCRSVIRPVLKSVD